MLMNAEEIKVEIQVDTMIQKVIINFYYYKIVIIVDKVDILKRIVQN